MRWMHRAIVVPVGILFISIPMVAQTGTKQTKSIHQVDSELHRWDVLRVHPAVPELQKGVDLAREGKLTESIRAFQKAAPKRRSLAWFNIGVVYLENGNPAKAYRYLQKAYDIRKDSVCAEYLANARRQLKEQKTSR